MLSIIAGHVDWGVVGAIVGATGVVTGGMWKVWGVVTGWRNTDAQAMGKLAHLFARWMDQTDDHLATQDTELYDLKNRLHTIEGAVGISAQPPRPVPARKVKRQMEAMEVFGPPSEYGLDHEDLESQWTDGRSAEAQEFLDSRDDPSQSTNPQSPTPPHRHRRSGEQ